VRETIDARVGQRDRIVVTEDVCRDLQAGLVALLDHRARQCDRQFRRAPAAIVDPDFQTVDLARDLLAGGKPRLSSVVIA
jgi:hypothetical protein